MRVVASIFLYISVLVFALISHWALKVQDAGIFLSVYLPVFFSAFLIHIFEKHIPYCRRWLTNIKDMTTDAFFMTTVQIILPNILSFLVVIFLLNESNSRGWIIQVWPHDTGLLFQVSILLLCGDFLSYWAHRLFHKLPLLWRFHEIHHSPKKMYWLNVGRFHPIEKTIHYAFEAVPFILLGVSVEVFSVYFIVYAIIGFFQHCNIDLKLGLLNYVVSGPELHRWHHSVNERRCNKNYGNNLIIWDVIFGTYYFKKKHAVEPLGLSNQEYPQSFLKQIVAPFTRS
jgi:sterol desaturase/sphingolipid hydroxylase (fatty acid hydroxylase superfamily)